MTEQELIARLLDEETDLADCAVDHIEQTRAKLAKAVEALQFYTHDYVYSGSKARAVLAELEETE